MIDANTTNADSMKSEKLCNSVWISVFNNCLINRIGKQTSENDGNKRRKDNEGAWNFHFFLVVL